ncbi:MerR family transcriptional regulator [Actinoplanes sp. TRM 88003]|uniref:MerR family transcriptional regulator n=1 Tax=Paractinoplanes aksuensis TaxID=2939490 RepID=A0ABT1DVW9_9ACTN|nr:MerR family transcriptional regulator [Actinoplanes aksuensis]MCO8274998.1 MerR family transcriptional regulator [Actinoplanes aksuensis]
MTTPLTILEMSRRSGFSEPTLRYYEKTGLLGRVDRDPGTGHRRYDGATAERVEALACLRSSGVSVDGLRDYVRLVEVGVEAADELRDLFATQAGQLAAEIERLRVRHEYLRLKQELWAARGRGDDDTDVIRRLNEVLQAF